MVISIKVPLKEGSPMDRVKWITQTGTFSKDFLKMVLQMAQVLWFIKVKSK